MEIEAKTIRLEYGISVPRLVEEAKTWSKALMAKIKYSPGRTITLLSYDRERSILIRYCREMSFDN